MKRSQSRINSFFIEIIIVIFFFAVSVTVILQLFALARSKAQQSSDLSVAVIKAQDIAEQIKGISSPEEIPTVLKTARQTDLDGGSEHYIISYDGQWNTTQANPDYRIDVSIKKSAAESGILVNAEVSVTRCRGNGNNEILTLNSAKYLPGKRGVT